MHYDQEWLDPAQTRLSLSLDGKLVFGQFEKLQSFIFDLKSNPPKHITFDLADVDLIDSSGLGLLIIANEITGENRCVTLKNANPSLKHLFDVCKLDELMEIES